MLMSVLQVAVQAQGIEKTSRDLEKLDRTGRRTAVATEGLEKQVTQLDKASARTAASTGAMEQRFSHLDNTVGDFNRTITAARNAVKLVKFPALIAGAGVAAQTIGALTAGAVSLGSALAPLAGLGAAVGAGYAALGQVLGTAQLAMVGLDTALKAMQKAQDGTKLSVQKYQDALKRLTPAQRDFVLVLDGAQKKFKALQNVAAAGVLPGVTSALKDVLPLFGRVRAVIGSTAVELGNLARRAGETVKTWGGDLTRVGAANVHVLHNLGLAAIAAAGGVKDIVVAGGPLLVWMSRMVRVGTEWVAQQIHAARTSGALAGFLDKTRAVMVVLWNISRDVAVALFNIARAGAPLGRDLLGAVEKLAAKFREWTESVKGQNAIAQYFRDAREPIFQLAGLIGDVAGAFLRISTGQGAGGMIARLRTLVPVLESVVASTTAAFGPVLIDALVQILRVVAELAGTSGPLTAFVRIIGLLAGALADLLTAVPGLNTMVVSFIGLNGVMRITGALVGPLTAGLGLMATALLGESAAADTAGLANLRLRLSMMATAAAMYAESVALAVLGGALAILTSPITLVVLAVAAFAAGMVIAYQQSATFRAVVQSVFDWLSGASKAVGQVASAAPHAIAAAWHAATGAVVGEVSQWDLLFAVIKGGLRVVVDFNRAMLLLLVAIWRAAMLALGPIVTAAWTLIKGIFSAGFAALKGIVTGGFAVLRGVVMILGGLFKGDFGQMWEGVKTIFRGAITALKGILEGAWKILKAPVDAIAAGLHDAFAHSWDRIKGLFESSVKAVIGFLNTLRDAVNVVLDAIGVKKIPEIGGGGGNSKGPGNQPIGHLAHGGAFARTGGYINSPITLMGEEAPTHPEWVIPENPAYRKRARGLLAQAAQAIGMAQGGQYSQGEIMGLWTGQGGASSRRLIAGAVAMAESGGNANAVSANPAGGVNRGLYQIWSGNPGSTFDPAGNTRTAIRMSSDGANWGQWEAFTSGAYRKFLGKGRGAQLPGGGSSVADVLGSLPKLTDGMGMFKDVGKYVLDKASAFVKDKIGGLFTTGGPSGPGLIAKGPKGVGSFMGVPMANWVIESLQYAQSQGVTVRPTSGYRPGFDPHTATGRSEHQGTQYPHGAVDFGGYNTGGAMKMAVVNATRNFKYPLLAPIGFHDEGHASGTGHAKGGVFSYLGSFKKGGITDKAGMAYLHANEAVMPLKKGGPNRSASKQGVTVSKGIARSAPTIRFKPPRVGPAKGIVYPAGPAADPAPAGDSGGADVSQADQALIDAINAQTAATEAETEAVNHANELRDLILANQGKILAMAGQGDQILAAVVAAVNGGIGGKTGLGFQSVSYPGGIARYK